MVYAFFRDKRKFRILLCLVGGVVMGTVIFNCLNTTEQSRIYIYSNYISKRIISERYSSISYMRHVFLYRLKEVIVIAVLGLTPYRCFFHNAIVFYFGMKLSILMCLLTAVRGKMAFVCFPVLLFPQIIVQVLLIYYLIRIFDFDYDMYEKKAKKFLIIFVELIALVICESMINPIIVNTFLKNI